MAEKWQEVPGQIGLGQDEIVYNVTDEVVIRSVQETGLKRDRGRLQLEIDAINADLAKISELRAVG